MVWDENIWLIFNNSSTLQSYCLTPTACRSINRESIPKAKISLHSGKTAKPGKLQFIIRSCVSIICKTIKNQYLHYTRTYGHGNKYQTKSPVGDLWSSQCQGVQALDQLYLMLLTSVMFQNNKQAKKYKCVLTTPLLQSFWFLQATFLICVSLPLCPVKYPLWFLIAGF